MCSCLGLKKAAFAPQNFRQVLRYLKSVLSLNNSTGVYVCFRIGTSRSPRLLVPLRDHSYGNLFHLEIYFHVNQNHFHKRGYAGGLVLKQRHKFNRKWSIDQLRYTKTQSNTINLSTRLWGINPTPCSNSPEPRTEVYCFLLNFNITKLVYWSTLFPDVASSWTA